ncbi:hypothetical protein NVP1084O_017 [Vibrio phage 1.084.O._10N.261.49.F5]|nr:hypothetical protein NVP1084O_017 [Vibrio phage 1.084.O._10N.261.49.F5]
MNFKEDDMDKIIQQYNKVKALQSKGEVVELSEIFKIGSLVEELFDCPSYVFDDLEVQALKNEYVLLSNRIKLIIKSRDYYSIEKRKQIFNEITDYQSMKISKAIKLILKEK